MSNGQTETPCVLGSTLLLRVLVIGRLSQATPRELPRKHAAWRDILIWCPSFPFNCGTSVYVELVIDEGRRGSEKGVLSNERTEAHPCERPRTRAAAHPAWWASNSGYPA